MSGAGERGPDAEAAPRGRRGPRRATGGTQRAVPADGDETPDAALPAAGPVPAADAVVPSSSSPERAPDDTDLGWGELGGDDDERFLREVPPHW